MDKKSVSVEELEFYKFRVDTLEEKVKMYEIIIKKMQLELQIEKNKNKLNANKSETKENKIIAFMILLSIIAPLCLN